MPVRTSTLLAAGAALAVAASPIALAHSDRTATSPRSGAAVKTLPGSVTVTFGEQIGRVVSVRVTRKGSSTNYVRSYGLDKRNVKRVKAVLRSVGPKGTYTVRWAIVSADGHKQNGTFTFRTLRKG